MANYGFAATFTGAALESKGIGVGSVPEYFFFSPLALVTQGFIYGPGDIWFDVDSEVIQTVTWVECDCDAGCD